MSGDKRLSSLLTKVPMDTKRIVEYSRKKKLDTEVLVQIAMTYAEFSREKNIGCDVTPLHIACSRGKPDIVQILLKESLTENENINEVTAPLRIALDYGNIPVARMLVKMGVDVENMDYNKTTPMAAALSQHKREKSCVSCVKLLLEAGVSVDHVLDAETLQRPIHLAVINNLSTVVSFLLRMGADADICDIHGTTPLQTAIYYNRIEIVKLLIRHGVDFYIENRLGDSAILLAVKQGCTQSLEAVISGGCDVNRSVGQAPSVSTPLHTAVYLCKLDIVKLLLDAGANPEKTLSNTKDLGATPLHLVATRNISKEFSEEKDDFQTRRDIAELLIDKGAKVNAVDNQIRTPVQLAIYSGFLGLAKLLMKLGANINTRQRSYDTLFHEVIHTNRDIIVHFLEHGGDYNAYNKMRLTPYHLAISKRVDVKFIRSFVKLGCPYNQDLSVWNNISKACYQDTKQFFAAEKMLFKCIKENNLKLAQIAIKEGAVARGCSEEMKYPLHFLAYKGYKEMLTYLLEQNVPLNSLNEKGETPLYIAAKRGHYQICCTLLRFGACYNYYSKTCPKKPEIIASECKHKAVTDLLHGVSRMFGLARLRKQRVVTELKSKRTSDFNLYLIYVNAINSRGDTLLATALRNNNSWIAEIMMKLRLS